MRADDASKQLDGRNLKKKDHAKYTTAEMPIYNLTEQLIII